MGTRRRPAASFLAGNMTEMSRMSPRDSLPGEEYRNPAIGFPMARAGVMSAAICQPKWAVPVAGAGCARDLPTGAGDGGWLAGGIPHAMSRMSPRGFVAPGRVLQSAAGGSWCMGVLGGFWGGRHIRRRADGGGVGRGACRVRVPGGDWAAGAACTGNRPAPSCTPLTYRQW